MLILLCLILLVSNVTCYMTKYQWKIIDSSIIYYKKIQSNDYLKPIHNYIYENHHNWTIKFTNKFVETNLFYLKPSQHNELYLYATRGLLKAIQNYDGYGNFYSYSSIYMKSELYHGISNLGPMRLLPHHYRVNKKWRKKNSHMYDKWNAPIGRNINWKSSYLSPLDTYMKKNILSFVNELTNEDRLLFSLRYDEKMNKKYTLEKIADFYGYSKETIRLKLIKLHERIKTLIYND